MITMFEIYGILLKPSLLRPCFRVAGYTTSYVVYAQGVMALYVVRKSTCCDIMISLVWIYVSCHRSCQRPELPISDPAFGMYYFRSLFQSQLQFQIYILMEYSLWGWGVTFHVLDVSHETPDVTPCRTSPPMPFVRTCLARNAWCNTRSHLTAAGCSSRNMLWVSPWCCRCSLLARPRTLSGAAGVHSASSLATKAAWCKYNNFLTTTTPPGNPKSTSPQVRRRCRSARIPVQHAKSATYGHA